MTLEQFEAVKLAVDDLISDIYSCDRCYSDGIADKLRQLMHDVWVAEVGGTDWKVNARGEVVP